MRKIFTLAALLVGMASTAFAVTGGVFTWTGTGATYDATLNALILEDASLTELTVTTSGTDTSCKIYVKGAQNTISPASKKDGIVFDVTSGTKTRKLSICGMTADAKLIVEGQSHAGFYLKGGSGQLYMEGLDIIFRGKLQDAQYGVDAERTNSLTLQFGSNMQMTMDGKAAPFNNIYTMYPGSFNAKLIYPAGGSLNNTTANNNFVKDADGNQYYGLTTIVSQYSIEVNDIRIYRGEENFTAQTSGSVSIKDGILTLDNAVIDGELYIGEPSLYGIKFIGTNVVNGEGKLYMGGYGSTTDFPIDGEGDNASFTVNGRERFGENLIMTVKNVALRNYYTGTEKTFCIWGDSYYSKMVLEEGSFVYVEAQSTGIVDYSASTGIYVTGDGYQTATGTTDEGNQYIYIRYLQTYLDNVVTQDGVTHEINSENASDVLGDGTVAYDRPTKTMTLKNAKLASVVFAFSNSTIYLEGNNQIFANATTENPTIGSLADSLTITGPGSVTLITQQADKAAIVKPGPSLVIRNTTVNITTQSYAISGITMGSGSSYQEFPLDVLIDNSNVSILSGQVGALNLITNFTLERAEFVSPADVDYFNGQFCVNYQPIAANTKVEIKALAEGIEEVIANTPDNKAHKVLVDGVIYIVRDGKLFNLQGAEVK